MDKNPFDLTPHENVTPGETETAPTAQRTPKNDSAVFPEQPLTPSFLDPEGKTAPSAAAPSVGFYDPYRTDARPTPPVPPAAPQQPSTPSFTAQNWQPPRPSSVIPPKKPKNKTGLVVFLCIALFALGILSGIGIYYLAKAPSLDDPSDLPVQGIQGETDENEQGDEATPEFESGTFAPVFGETDETFRAAEIYKNSVGGVVGISTEISMENIFGQQTAYAVSGTGFIFSEDGYILTNCHIVEGASTITVTLYDETEYEAKLIGKDSQNDVAVLKIEPKDPLTVLTMGKSADMVVGEEILVIGNPLGELTYTLTRGIVSNLSREIMVEDSMTSIRMFQTDAAINAGNSGGPAINCHGNVIGIVSAKYASSDIEGLGFCIPIDDAMQIAQDLIEHGYVQGRPWLGIEGQAVSGNVGSTHIAGVRITALTKGSCAEKAGMRRGDIITKIGDTEVTTASELKTTLLDYKAGDEATLSVWRNGETILITVTLDEAQQ